MTAHQSEEGGRYIPRIDEVDVAVVRAQRDTLVEALAKIVELFVRRNEFGPKENAMVEIEAIAIQTLSAVKEKT